MKRENRNAMIFLLGLIVGIVMLGLVAYTNDIGTPADSTTVTLPLLSSDSLTLGSVPPATAPSDTDPALTDPEETTEDSTAGTTAPVTAPPSTVTDRETEPPATETETESETYWWEVEESVDITFEEEPYVPFEPPLIYDLMGIPSTPKGYFKSYTSYKALGTNTPQWKNIQCHPDAYTDPNGLRKVGNYYCVAMGSFYTRRLGDLFEITTESGTFRVIITDFKSDRHTDANHQYGSSTGCMVEFYVDIQKLPDLARKMGNISYVYPSFFGYITQVAYIGNYFDLYPTA